MNVPWKFFDVLISFKVIPFLRFLKGIHFIRSLAESERNDRF